MNALTGKRIWVTRPAGQAATLVALLRQANAVPVELPLLRIGPPCDDTLLAQAVAILPTFDLAAFVSPSAIDAVFGALDHGWPNPLPAAVIGPGSAKRAMAYGIHAVIAPARRFDSEGLLAEPAMALFAGKRIVLFRGETGRELLVDGLTRLASELTIVPAYRRSPSLLDDKAMTAALGAGCDAIIISSSEAAQHLFTVVGAATREQLQSMRYFAPHPAIVTVLAQQGARNIVLSQAGDAGIVVTLDRYFAGLSTP